MLNLKRAQTILSVSVVVSSRSYTPPPWESTDWVMTIQLRGQVITSSRPEGAHTFLEVETRIWDSTMNVATSHSTGAVNGKLQGRHTWPFSIPFPTEFSDSFALPGRKRRDQNRFDHEDDSQATYSTPQTLCQRGINANIQYEVRLKIITSGIFNSKHK